MTSEFRYYAQQKKIMKIESHPDPIEAEIDNNDTPFD